MHEFSVMSGVVKTLANELHRLEREEGREIERVNEVILEVGELTFLGNEQLQFCYHVLTEKNILQGSKLTIITVLAEIVCKECGYQGAAEYFREFHLKTPILSCPTCRSPVKIVKGRECSITSMNLEVRD